MRPLRRWLSRTAGLLQRGDGDMNDELRFHIDMQTADNVRAGMDPDEARRSAVLKFGPVEAVKDTYRDQRSWPSIDNIAKDLKFAWRSLRRRPAFTTVAVVSIGLGIGLNATVFSWLKAVYVNPLPGVRDARELVSINASYTDRAGYSNSWADYQLIRENARGFQDLFIHEALFAAIGDGSTSEKVMGGFASANYFDVLGVHAALGRFYRPEEDEVEDRDAVIVLSHHLWQRRFGSDPRIVGRRVLVNRVPFTVVGIAAPEFRGAYGGIAQDYWVPVHMSKALDDKGQSKLGTKSWFQIMGRPKPGVSLATLQSELDVISARARATFRKNSPDYRATAYPLHRSQRGYHSGIFELVRVLGIACALVLVLACINVAGLLLARANERAHEITIRFSLGASRGRVIRQLMVESALLATLGGVAGLAVALAAQRVPDLLSGMGMELIFNSALDWRVGIFLAAATAISAVLFGLAPAIETSGLALGDTLRNGARNLTAGKRRARLRSAVVVVQVALSTVALGAAAMVADSVRKQVNADRGFRTDHLLTAQVDAASAGLDADRGRAFYRAVTQSLESSPEVVSAAWTSYLPMSSYGGSNSREAEVRGFVPADGRPLSVVVDTISAGYLKTIGMSLVRGREFLPSDSENAPKVVIVNRKFVEQYLSGRDPIGAAVRIGSDWRTVVGVNGDYIYRSPGSTPDPAVFLPLDQDYSGGAIAVVRTRHDPWSFAPVLRDTVAKLNAEIPVARTMTMQQNVDTMFLGGRLMEGGLAIFSAMACILAAIGLYGLLAAFVNQRRREFGVRTALGATTFQLCGMVLRQSVVLTVIGAVIGLGLSFGVARVMRSAVEMLQQSNDVLTLVAAAIGVAITAIVASVPPFASAARIDPVEALRYE